MPMTALTIIFLFALATIFGAGLLADRVDPAASILLGFLAAVLFGIGGMASFSVASEAWQGTRPMRPFAVVGIGLSLLTFMLTLANLRRLVAATGGLSSVSAR